MLKQTILATAALAFAVVPAFAHHSSGGTNYWDSFNTSTENKTITVTKAEVNNSADISNDVYTGANTGFNYTSTKGGSTSSTTTAMTGNVSGDTSSGNASGDASSGDATGGNTGGDATAASLTGGGDTGSWVSTGDASATSTVLNVVNTTFIHF